MDFKNMSELFRHVEKKANETLKSEVAEVAVKTMQEKVEEEVYSVYEPAIYERTGGLLRDIDVEIIDDKTISIENTRYEDGRNIAEIVETGQGYQYDFSYNGVPRPFTEATREELKNTDKLKNAIKKGLKNRGINTEG